MIKILEPCMKCSCRYCGRTGLPRAPGLSGEPVAHVREVRQGGDVKSEFRPCVNYPAYDARYEAELDLLADPPEPTP